MIDKQLDSNESALDNPDVEWMTIVEAVTRMGCSASNIHYRVKKHGWKKRKGIDGLLWIAVPLTQLNQYETSRLKPESNVVQPESDLNPPEPTMTSTLIQTIQDLYEARLEDQKLLIQQQKEVIDSLKVQLESTNNLLSNAQNKIVTLKKDPQPAEPSTQIETLAQTVDTLTRTMAALQDRLDSPAPSTKATEQKRAWWRNLFVSIGQSS